MCGIAGILSRNTSVLSGSRLKLMTDKLAHRGPNGEGVWINQEGTVGLGHRRLSIIDLSDAGRQPMPYLERYTIIHNGEIYNYIELREELIKKGYHFSTATDTEVITAAYDHYQEDCLYHFDGMFAFAIWDEKKKELFAARDRFGEKPLFYYQDKNQFLFSSEMKALWAAGIEKTVNRKLLFNYLTIGYVNNPNIPEESFFENISKLPAASFLKYFLPGHRLSIFNYWDIDSDIQNTTITDEEAVEEFRYLFRQSVKNRYRSDVPVGTSLSGGLDSSAVVATAHSLQPGSDSHLCFSAVFPGFEKDESRYSGLVAKKFQLQQMTTEAGAGNLHLDLEKIFYHQEEPFESASILAQYQVYALAKRHHIKVLLDGQGADETLAGYHKYYKWYWQELYRKRKLVSSGELEAARALGIREKFGWKNRVAALLPEFAFTFLENQYLVNALQHPDLTREFVRLQSKEAYYTTPGMPVLNAVLYFNTFMHGLEELLRYADRNAMAHGCEVRLPFLNHELVEFVFSLPSRFKIRQGYTKWILRKTMQDLLPGEINWRPEKIGYEPPQKTWMQQKEIQELILDAKKKLAGEKIIRPEAAEKTVVPKAAHEAGNYDWRYLSASFLFK